jgi:formylmethanofuran dehydrogenase subunit A
MLRIARGRVYDPANGVDGEVRDVCLDDGKVVEALPSHAPRIDAAGMVVMPGGVDIHSHIAGPKINAARKLTPEEHRADVLDRTAVTRSGTGGTVPSTFATGYRYALLGYTTVVDAATPPLAARHTLAELRDTPIVDKAFLVLMGNNLSLFDLIREAGPLTEAVAWWLEATGGYGVKLVNPGGVEMWKHGNRNVTSLDDEVEGLGVTPRGVLEAIATAVDELGLPHPVHVHCNNLGVAGNWRTTLDTLDTLQGRRAHLAHLQFHAYGGTPGKRPRSRAPELAEHLDAHPEHSADIGQVMFGPATTLTADAPVSALLREITGGKWVNADLEAETGCGIVPFAYRERNYVHALQWGIGLELFLLSRDPWRVVLSTDHPNGGSFLSYPRLIRLLMDREFRDEQIGRVNQKAMRRTVLRDRLDREYTLGEIAIITRAGPARLLGLADKGHLGVGADADVTVYAEHEDREQMFATPRYVIKSGRIIVEDGELREAPAGDLLRVAADHDGEIEDTLRPLFEKHYSVRLANYPVREPWLLEPARTISARRGGSGR